MGTSSIHSWWDSIRTSLWFVPVICVSVAIILSIIMPEMDHQLDDQDGELPPWVFGGSSDGARSILSTIAGSLVTIVGVVFSITIVVLQQASSQFTPRVMGNFIRQTGTQLVLGVYLATFLYSVLVLRYVRGEDSQAEEFIPRLSIAVSLLLATVCLGLLVYFIHHMATSLQASAVISNVKNEFSQDIEWLYPEHIGDPVEERDEPLSMFRQEHLQTPTDVIRSKQSGFLMSVDEDAIVEHATGCTVVAILPQIGEFVTLGMPIVELSGSAKLPESASDGIRSGLILGQERSRYQDPLFSIRQLVDIALKALSPGINDPTTAKNSISMLGAALAELADRSFPAQVRVVASDQDATTQEIHIWTNRPGFADYVNSAFSEIRRIGTGNVAVTAHLVDTLGDLANSINAPHRATALHYQLNEISSALADQDFSESDERDLRERIDGVRNRLP